MFATISKKFVVFIAENSLLKFQELHRLKSTLSMNTAFFRHVEGEPDFHVALRYVNDSLKIDKQFNFCRKMTEAVASFTNRVDANVEKIREKRSKRKKGAPIVEDQVKTAKSALLCNGRNLEPDYPCAKIFEKNSGTFTLDLLGDILPITVNAPWVEIISLPKSTMAGFIIYPCKFESFFVDRKLCDWAWFRSKKPNGTEWQLCGQNEIYETQNEDVGYFLKVTCKPSNGTIFGPEVSAVSPSAVEAGPGPLPFTSRHYFTPLLKNSNELRVCSYNILADYYVDSEYSRTVLFGYCPAYALELSYRRQLLLKEITGYNADLICLQEVDSKVFRHDLLPVLENCGISGIYSPKGTTNEGSAVFFNKEKLNLVESRSVLLSDILQSDPLFTDIFARIKSNPAFVERILGRSTTLQVLMLEPINLSDKILIVANIHLYFHPDADHIRLFQAGLAVKYLENLLDTTRLTHPSKQVSIIWCGDFNSVPECGIFQLMTSGSVSDDHIDWKSNEVEAVNGISLQQNLKFGSACGTPKYTNYTVGFKACLDYIFYDTKSFQVMNMVPLPGEEELSAHLAIPSVVFPSDHVALVADLKFL